MPTDMNSVSESNGGNETSTAATGSVETSIPQTQGGYTSAFLIPVVGIVTGAFIVGVAVKAIDRRNAAMQYRSLDSDSLSNFSLQA